MNEYGLDVNYFKEKLSLILRDIENYKPEEMHRELSRLAAVVEPAPEEVSDEPIYQWQHSRAGALNSMWHDCNEADFNVRDNKPQFNVRILFETDAVTESLRSENAAQAKRIATLEGTSGLLQTQVHCLEMVAASKNGD